MSPSHWLKRDDLGGDLAQLILGVERIPASPPSKGDAREEVTVVVSGVEQTLEIVRQERIHGTQAYWLCSQCGAPRWHLYVSRDGIVCRECLGLSYACRHTRNTAALRARKLRRRLGGLPAPLGPLPSRPRHWRRDYWARAIAQLLAIESVLTARLGVMVERRSSKRDRRSDRGP
jgi:hypothetical protein